MYNNNLKNPVPFDQCSSLLQPHPIGCSGLQNLCQLHYHTADSVLTSGCSFISQHIWIKICIMLAILGRSIKSKRFSSGKLCMWIGISGRQIDDLGTLSSGFVTCWGRWRFRQRWRWLWSLLSALDRWRCACSFASPSCLPIPCSAIFRRKASGCVVLTNHSRVTFYRSFPLIISRVLNTPLHLFSDLGVRFLDQELRFLYRGVQKPSFGHFRHIQGQAHVGPFQMYPTSLLCHSSRHVENLQEIGCCL